MTKSKAQLRTKYFQLMKRVNEIGSEFPRPEDVDVNDEQAMMSVRLLLQDFEKANNDLAKLSNKINRRSQ